MRIDYILADPTGNITVLIRSDYSGSEERAAMIREAFVREPSCEQAGFIVSKGPGHISIEMMGYEFCGNAVLSSASWQAYCDGLEPGSRASVKVTSTGADHPLDVTVIRLPDKAAEGRFMPVFRGTVSMPEPSLGSYKGHPLVSMSGISHLIIPEKECSGKQAENMIRGIAEELGAPALGIILCSEITEHSVSIKPLVYVPESDTLVWEHGCATGSTAAGYCFFRKGIAHGCIDVIQPGGTISIAEDGQDLLLSGQVILHV